MERFLLQTNPPFMQVVLWSKGHLGPGLQVLPGKATEQGQMQWSPERAHQLTLALGLRNGLW